jgi:PHD/YefM family antitoxin component YafN of YafNO toxin-antitoxin module
MIMELSEIKSKIEDTIKTLPPDKLKIVLDLLEDLKRTDEEETQLLLDDIGFMEEYRQAKEDIRTGQTIKWEDIKRDV